MIVFLNTNRTGYTPEQCGRTLTVRELIDELEQYNDDTKVYFKNDNGYTYGKLYFDTIEEGEEEDADA